MTKEIGVAEKVLDIYARGNDFDDYEGCYDVSSDDDCAGTLISRDDALIFHGAIDDGVFEREELAKLTFLSKRTINTLAGCDGTKPAEFKANLILKKLSRANLRKSAELIIELDGCHTVLKKPSISSKLTPIALRLLDTMIPKEKKNRGLEEKYGDRMDVLGEKRDYDRISYVAYKTYDARIDRFNDKINRLDFYDTEISVIIRYLSTLEPVPEQLLPLLIEKLETNQVDRNSSYVFEGLANIGTAEAMNALTSHLRGHVDDPWVLYLAAPSLLSLYVKTGACNEEVLNIFSDEEATHRFVSYSDITNCRKTWSGSSCSVVRKGEPKVAEIVESAFNIMPTNMLVRIINSVEVKAVSKLAQNIILNRTGCFKKCPSDCS